MMREAMEKAGLLKSKDAMAQRWLRSWVALQPHLARENDEETILHLMQFEKAHKKRAQIISRIWSRYKTVRNAREEAEIVL